MSDENVGALFWLALIFIGTPWAIWHYDLNPMNNEITIYRQVKYCAKNNENCSWKNHRSTTFSIVPSQQSVIFWTSNEQWPLQKAEDCIVVNKKHWNCGKHYTYGFNQGEFTRKNTDQHRFVSKTKWWLNKL